jgi:hypothetical protein
VAATKGRPGRKPRAANQGQRVSLGLKVTPEIKNRLDAAARARGRTQSQEAEARLERSFRAEDEVKGALALAYGRRVGGILLVLARAMNDAGWGSGLIKTNSFEGAADWLDEPWAYDQMVQAAKTVLEAFRPEGEIHPPPPPVDPITFEPRNANYWDDLPLGIGFANACLEALRGNADKTSPAMKEWADEIVRDMLGTRPRPRKPSAKKEEAP